VTHSDGERIDIYKDRKEDTNFKLADMPEGRELKYPSSPDAVAGALSYMSMDDVKPADQVDFNALPPGPGNDIATAEYRTWDGVVIVARAAKIGDRTWVKFEARYEEPPPLPAAPETTPAPSPVDPSGGEVPPPPPDGSPTSGPSAPQTQPAAQPGAEPPKAEGESKPDEAETTRQAAQTEASQLHAKLSPWAYAVAEYQANNLMMRREGLLKELPGQPSTLTPPEGIESLVPGSPPLPASGDPPADPPPPNP
jgi:hypothetical protein